jgi:hypothetical protein
MRTLRAPRTPRTSRIPGTSIVVVAIAVLVGVTVHIHAQTAAPNEVSSIAGRWTLNKDLSDTFDMRAGGRTGGRPNGGFPAGRGGGRFPGGGGGFPGGGFPGDDFQFGGGFPRGGGYPGGGRADSGASDRLEALRPFVEAPKHLAITQDGSTVTIVGDNDRTTRLTLDGKKVKDESENIERKTTWENGKLVSKISGAAGNLTEIYSADTGHRELLVILRIDGSGGEAGRVLHRLYSADTD